MRERIQHTLKIRYRNPFTDHKSVDLMKRYMGACRNIFVTERPAGHQDLYRRLRFSSSRACTGVVCVRNRRPPLDKERIVFIAAG